MKDPAHKLIEILGHITRRRRSLSFRAEFEAYISTGEDGRKSLFVHKKLFDYPIMDIQIDCEMCLNVDIYHGVGAECGKSLLTLIDVRLLAKPAEIMKAIEATNDMVFTSFRTEKSMDEIRKLWENISARIH